MATSSTYFHQKKKTSSTYSLPRELEIKILLCLPVKYMVLCKLVCKQWQSIISDPDFIKTHLTISQKRPSVLTAAEVFDKAGSFYQTVSIISNSFQDSVNLPVPSSYPAPDHSSSSCNGLMCLNDSSRTNIYLWNPSTRQGKQLPCPEIKEHNAYLVCVGFYFDSISNDYKIVRLVFSYPCEAAGESGLTVRAEHYSTKSDSWREIQVDHEAVHESFVVYNRNKGGIVSGPVIKRVLYVNGSRGPISFHLNNGMLKPVPLPSNYRINYELQAKKWEPKVFDFQGRAALILHGNNDESLSLWTLDDDDGRGSWTPKLNLEADIMKNWTSIYFGVGQLVAWEDYKRIILYDYQKKETKEHRLQLPNNWYIDSFFRYTESLVSVEGFSNL